MELDREIATSFAEEILGLKNELSPLVTKLQEDRENLGLYASCGNIVDRIFGTAATLGLKEIAEYSKMMKETCYLCSQSDSSRAHIKVVSMLEDCVRYLDKIAASIHNPTDLKKVRYSLHVENARGAQMVDTVFSGIKRKSVSS